MTSNKRQPKRMKPRLNKSAERLREQVNYAYPKRDKRSDGWIGDAKHSATKSDHNPDSQGWVRALDIDADLSAHKSESLYLAEQIRLYGKVSKRIAYVIHNGKIASPILNWKWRKYSGVNPHHSHIHISFTKAGDEDESPLDIPMLRSEK